MRRTSLLLRWRPHWGRPHLAVAPSAPTSAQGGEVVVYTARHYGQEAAFEAFTKKTGIALKLLAGQTGELFERLKAEGERTPADVLITVDAGNLWNAGRAGLLAKVDSPELTSNIPANLRDPEQRWFGLTVRARTIMYNTRRSPRPSCRPTRRSVTPSGRGASACGPRRTSTTSRCWPR